MPHNLPQHMCTDKTTHQNALQLLCTSSDSLKGSASNCLHTAQAACLDLPIMQSMVSSTVIAVRTQHRARHCAAQRSAAQHSTGQQSAAQHSTAQHSTAQHSTAQRSTAQHSTADLVSIMRGVSVPAWFSSMPLPITFLYPRFHLHSTHKLNSNLESSP